MKKILTLGWLLAMMGTVFGAVTPVNTFNLNEKPEGIIISSLCSTSSPSLLQSRLQAMAGIVGTPGVPTDRADNPTAWYVIPENDLQIFDVVRTTNFHMWMGSTVLTNTHTSGEFGHRGVVHLAGRYPVGQYTCRIRSSIPDIGNTVFFVGNETGLGGIEGREIPFNSSFIGINFGPNGIMESRFDLVQGRWIQLGDDKVFSNGEFPSQISYDVWYRFGASFYVDIKSPAGFESLKALFSSGVQFIRAELVVGNNQVVATREVRSSPPKLLINQDVDPLKIQLGIEGGQTMLQHSLYWTSDLGNPWIQIERGLNTGQRWKELKGPGNGFYRLQ